jgi:serine/threonine protein phosphatase PrpC
MCFPAGKACGRGTLLSVQVLSSVCETTRKFQRMTTTKLSPVSRLSAWFMRRTTPSALRRVVSLNAAVASDIGTVREENQDRVALVRGTDRKGAPFILAALADGMGGMKRGAECASVALGTFIEVLVAEAQSSTEPRDWLNNACHNANRAVHALHSGAGGSTLVAVLICQGTRPLWISVGDSRVYHAGDKFNQLSRDDTLEGQLGRPIEGGRRSELLQFVGIGDSLEPHIDQLEGDLSGAMLLTSDGVHFVDSGTLARVVHFAPDLGVCVRRMTELAKMLGGPDNASVVAIGLGSLRGDRESQLDSCFEVWDPYGELHVFFQQVARRSSSIAPVPLPVAAPSLEQTEVTHDTANTARDLERKRTVPVESLTDAARRKPGKKTRVPRKSKAKEQKVEGKQDEQDTPPQLFIEFPQKSS